MFPFGVVLALLGYSAIYVGVDRLAGDTRTVTAILTGNGQVVKSASSQGNGAIKSLADVPSVLPGIPTQAQATQGIGRGVVAGVGAGQTIISDPIGTAQSVIKSIFGG